MILRNGQPRKGVKPYIQPGPSSEIVPITNLQNAVIKIWKCTAPGIWNCLLKLCSSDNHQSMVTLIGSHYKTIVHSCWKSYRHFQYWHFQKIITKPHYSFWVLLYWSLAYWCPNNTKHFFKSSNQPTLTFTESFYQTILTSDFIGKTNEAHSQNFPKNYY